MKSIIAITALVASVASASAMTNPTAELERFVTPEQAATLSEAEVVHLPCKRSIRWRAKARKRAAVRSLVQ